MSNIPGMEATKETTVDPSLSKTPWTEDTYRIEIRKERASRIQSGYDTATRRFEAATARVPYAEPLAQKKYYSYSHPREPQPGGHPLLHPKQPVHCARDPSHSYDCDQYGPHHLIKCPKNKPHVAKLFELCDFNRIHDVRRGFMAQHLEVCAEYQDWAYEQIIQGYPLTLKENTAARLAAIEENEARLRGEETGGLGVKSDEEVKGNSDGKEEEEIQSYTWTEVDD